MFVHPNTIKMIYIILVVFLLNERNRNYFLIIYQTTRIYDKEVYCHQIYIKGAELSCE